MEVRFRYTIWECVYYAVRGSVQTYKRMKGFWIFVGIICLLILLPEVFVAGLSGESVGMRIFWTLIPLIGFVMAFILVCTVPMLIYFLCKEYPKEHVFCIGNGICYMKKGNEPVPEGIPCKNIISIKTAGPLIWLEMPVTKILSAYLLIPTRAFASRKERDEFSEYVRSQQNEEPVFEAGEVHRETAETWKIEFEMDKDLMVWGSALG